MDGVAFPCEAWGGGDRRQYRAVKLVCNSPPSGSYRCRLCTHDTSVLHMLSFPELPSLSPYRRKTQDGKVPKTTRDRPPCIKNQHQSTNLLLERTRLVGQVLPASHPGAVSFRRSGREHGRHRGGSAEPVHMGTSWSQLRGRRGPAGAHLAFATLLYCSQVDEIPLSRPKRNIARDFADGGEAWECLLVSSWCPQQAMAPNCCCSFLRCCSCALLPCPAPACSQCCWQRWWLTTSQSWLSCTTTGTAHHAAHQQRRAGPVSCRHV